MRKLLILALSAQLISIGAYADAIQVQDPQLNSEITLKQGERDPGLSYLDFAFSSWVPNGLRLRSFIPSDSEFASTGIPAMQGSYVLPFRFFKQNLGFRLGGGWLLLKRTGNLDNAGFSIPQSQTLNLALLEAAVEYSPARLSRKWFSPYIGAGVLPALGLTARSSFDPGYAYFGIAGEAMLGSRFSFRTVGIPWDNVDLDLSVIGTVGSLEGASLSGLGLRGGLRVGL